MQDSDVPTKFIKPFAADATATYSRPIPLTSTDPFAASQSSGFPPDTFVPPGAGGAPPNGKDVNGCFNMATAWDRWFSAGGPIKFDGTFSAAVDGYAKGSIVQSAITFGRFWFCTVQDNVSDPDIGGAGWIGFTLDVIPATGCRLQYSSPTSIMLAPKNGGYLWIDGFNYPVPADLLLANGGSASTGYYIYAYISAGVITLERSQTAYVLAANGMPQKVGDVTRTLVGWAYTNGSGQYVYSASNLGVSSYFNRSPNALQSAGTNASLVTSGTLVELNGGNSRIFFFTWAGDSSLLQASGQAKNGTVATTTGGLFIDNAAALGGTTTTATSAIDSALCSHCPVCNTNLSEGYHWVAPAGAVSSNTGTFDLIAFATIDG